MIYGIEIWNAKPAWLQLSVEERGDYMGKVGSAMEQMASNGIKALTWSFNDPATDEKADYDYFALWTFPSQELADGFFATVKGAGWYNYFDQVNLMGAEDTAQNVIGRIVQL